MESQKESQEVFRRSWWTVLPEWVGAGAVTLAVGLAAWHLGMEGSWEGITLMGLPLLWASGRTVQWFCHTWTITADRRLVMSRGVFLWRQRVIHLHSVSQVAAHATAAGRWLDAGHITFEMVSQQGRRHRFHWTWVHNHHRLYEILLARGQWPIGQPA